MVALEGDALAWFQWENQHPLDRRDELKKMVLRRFREVSGGSLHEQWLEHGTPPDGNGGGIPA